MVQIYQHSSLTQVFFVNSLFGFLTCNETSTEPLFHLSNKKSLHVPTLAFNTNYPVRHQVIDITL